MGMWRSWWAGMGWGGMLGKGLTEKGARELRGRVRVKLDVLT